MHGDGGWEKREVPRVQGWRVSRLFPFPSRTPEVFRNPMLYLVGFFIKFVFF